jgi:hypothetical protein
MTEHEDSLVSLLGRLNTSNEDVSRFAGQMRQATDAVTNANEKFTQTLVRCSEYYPETSATSIRDLSWRIANISRTCGAFGNLNEAIDSWKISVTDGIWALIYREDLSQLLEHFKSEIKAIIRTTLDTYGYHADAHRKILEQCYFGTCDRNGPLHSQFFFAVQDESSLQSPFDPDFQSAEYYEHENLLEIDEHYAKSHSIRQERLYASRANHRNRTQQSWTGFWLEMLEASDHGPTLFRSGASVDQYLPSETPCPRFLIRVSDPSSSGRTDDRVVASAASHSGCHQTDIFYATPKVAAKRLVAHLTKPLLDDSKQDQNNFMSWSSSFPFLIQYAIYRCGQLGSCPKSVNFCVVDTQKFPCGQFVRDTLLINKYYEHDAQLQNLRRLRQNTDFDNGEYLSQGTVIHSGRSCVFSLQELINAGLYKLYPEFGAASGKDKWPRRVRDLRSAWSRPQHTRQDELQQAAEIASCCFAGFDSLDISLLLLSFKNRVRHVEEAMDGAVRSVKVLYEPPEVQRHLELSTALQKTRIPGFGAVCGPVSILQRTFVSDLESENES